ncbi:MULTISPECIES: DNA-packaging protein [unclassified Sphingomonas]|uniref:DNA-packaging protein n=1 Tax=unclassified Sphingomonas TaxID=196159 RepID=UPI0006FB5CAC|nr:MULTISPECIES: terminase family protein [unclassified Sphingomonas]KQM57909.1 ATP-binding protein [Sphingomonas sp. Leaf16]KQN12805.1 ATP-binding protein [Sphingomonas sp. Leaf29]KQN19693.1 ATP-binding protein [Sphingomonas sp. Leaf32]
MTPRDPMIEELIALDDAEQARIIARLTPSRRLELATRWSIYAHAGQTVADNDWTVWLIQAGRGFGKTRAGAQWVCAQAADRGDLRIALVGANRRDVETVMVRGPAGLLAIGRHYGAVKYRPSHNMVEFGSGAKAFVYAAESPEGLRGPEHHVAWCDELAKWRNADATWDNLMMGMRMGERPQTLVTTTPRVIPLLRRIRAMPGVRITGGRSRDNRHLSESWFAQIEGAYAGTRLGRQELEGELIEDVAGALWSRAMIEERRVDAVPTLVRVVVGVDPPAGVGGDACGIVAVGKGVDGHAYVLEDASVSGLSPEGWAGAVAACAGRHGADRVVAESNQGGAMVASVLRAADAGLPVRLVHASRGKAARAEPVAALYEGGRAFHVRTFPALEDELCGLVSGGGYEGPGRSPDRADALVWAMFELMLGGRGEAVVRVL